MWAASTSESDSKVWGRCLLGVDVALLSTSLWPPTSLNNTGQVVIIIQFTSRLRFRRHLHYSILLWHYSILLWNNLWANTPILQISTLLLLHVTCSNLSSIRWLKPVPALAVGFTNDFQYYERSANSYHYSSLSSLFSKEEWLLFVLLSVMEEHPGSPVASLLIDALSLSSTILPSLFFRWWC